MKKERRSFPIDQCRLYKVSSPIDLAKRLKISLDELEGFAVDQGNYRVFHEGDIGSRLIEEPKPPLQAVHSRIHLWISRIETPEYLHSAIKGRSYITNAAAHVDEVGAVKIDVKKFFRSVPRVAVFRFFNEKLLCERRSSGLLANLLTREGHLPTGSSSSPIISYYAFKDLFDEIAAVALRDSLTMTCYVDDITISGQKAIPKLLKEVRGVITKHGLKSHKAIYFPPGAPIMVTGVAIFEGKLRLPHKRQLAIKTDYDRLTAAKTKDEKLDILKSLVSRVFEASSIDDRWLPKAKSLQKMRKELQRL